MTNLQKWLRTITWLRQEFPAQHKVCVRSKEMRDREYIFDGYIILPDKLFLIFINRKRNLSTKLNTLLHEWAHCLTWFGADLVEEHSDEWGLSYAKLYRAFEKWNFGEEE